MPKNNIKEVQEFAKEKILFAAKPELKNSGRLVYYKKVFNYEGFYSLAKVLNALKKNYLINSEGLVYEDIALGDIDMKSIEKWGYADAQLKYIFKWQLLNKNGSEATFQDQTEETQIAIAKLLGYVGVTNAA